MDKKKSFKDFLKKYILNITFISVFLISVGICILIILIGTLYFKNNQIKKVESYATTVINTIDSSLSSSFNNLHVMEEYIAYIDSHNADSSFDKIAKRMLSDDSDIKYLTFAKDSKINYVYPYRGNSYLYGKSYSADQDFQEFKDASLKNSFYIVSNEKLLSGRLPIYLENDDGEKTYWGVATIDIDVDNVFAEVEESLDETLDSHGYVCKICKVNSSTGAEETICETKAKFKDNSTTFGVSKVEKNIYGSEWVVYAAPYYSANDRVNYTIAAIATIIISFFAGLIYVEYRRVIEDKVNRELELKSEIIEKQSIEVRQSHDLLVTLASEYQALYLINVDEDNYERYSVDEEMAKNLGNKFDNITKYSEASDAYIENFISDEYQAEMKENLALSNIKKELRNKKTITFYFANLSGKYCEIRFVKTEDIDVPPHFVAFTFADKDEEIRKDKEYEESLHNAIDRAEAANKAKSEFLFAMSHDIRTPMNAIVGFTNMAKKYIDDGKKVSDYLTKVESSSNQLLNLINDILDMSRIESGNVVLDEKPHNLHELTKKFFDIYLFTAQEKNIDFTLNYNCEHDNILCDELRLSRIFMNIVSNSIKYTKSGGYVTFSISEEPNETDDSSKYICVVEDNGIGMSEEYQKRIFESFSREQTSTTSGIQGTGLGMAITKSLVDLMYGTISVESELGKGTKVTVEITFNYSNESEGEKALNNAVYAKASLEGKRILLVEDNELNREIAKDTLLDEGLIVDEACDGTEAVDIIKGLDDALYYDVILMDIQMPIMDGYKATTTIRTLKDVPNVDKVPIIAMTANAFEEDKQKAFDCGMNDHLAKPIDISMLKKTLLKFVK